MLYAWERILQRSCVARRRSVTGGIPTRERSSLYTSLRDTLLGVQRDGEITQSLEPDPPNLRTRWSIA
ncbi:hypothetical protein V2P20_02380, partial [Methylobacter sp. Wu1]|uniref:hypothetical protein n=1 Tax=Methylobacter sp. Wu1 TaxID=3119359 RepID=UPI002F928E53